MFRRLQDRMLGKSKSVLDPFAPPPFSPTDSVYIVPNSPHSPVSLSAARAPSPMPLSPARPPSPVGVGFIAQDSDFSSEEGMMPMTEGNLASILADRKSEIDRRSILERKRFAGMGDEQISLDRNPKNFLIRKGIQNSSVISNILNGSLNVSDVCIYSNKRSFVAVLNQGTALFGWGDPDFGGIVPLIPQGKRIKRIYASNGAYTALFHDGSCICWGDANYGGLAPFIPPDRAIEKMCGSGYGFAALLDDNSLIIWGGIAREDQYNTKLKIPASQTIKEIYGGHDFIAVHLNNGAIAYGGRVGSQEPIIPFGTTILSICPGICIYAVIFQNGSIMYGGTASYRLANRGPKPFIPAGSFIKEWHFTSDFFIVILDDESILLDWIIEDRYRYLSEKFSSAIRAVKRIYATQVSICILYNDGQIFFEVHPACAKAWNPPWCYQIYPSIPFGRTAVNIYANDGAYVAHLDNKKIVCFGTWEYGGITPEIPQDRTVLSICPGGSSFAAVLDNGEIIHWGSILLTRISIYALQSVNEIIRIPAGCHLAK